MIVVTHLAPSMAAPVTSRTHLAEYLQPFQPVLIGKIDIFLPITPRSHVIQTTGQFNT
jgi:hypothetical protein